MTDAVPLHGLLAEFPDGEALADAVRAARAEGLRRLDAFTPYPVEEVQHALELPPSPLPRLVLAGGAIGGSGVFALEWWSSVVAYPMDVGGRPLFSWPAFVVPAFEGTILGAALAAVLGTFVLARLPMPYHPVFHVERFERASRDAFFLLVESDDPRFDRDETRRLLTSLGAVEVDDVPL